MTTGNEKPVRLIVFDCDGTLVDSQHNIIAAMGRAFAEVGETAPSDNAVRAVVGLSLDHAILTLLEGRDDAGHVERLVAAYKQAFFEHRQSPDYSEPMFPMAREALQGLREAGYELGVATGKSARGLAAVLEHHDLDDLFVTLQTADVGPGKPHPAMLERAMEETGTLPDETVMIGDTSFDMMLARNAGCAGLGVAWGYHPVSELRTSGASHILEAFSDLMPYLARGEDTNGSQVGIR
jgi:phosphoglycolate phosphatase